MTSTDFHQVQSTATGTMITVTDGIALLINFPIHVMSTSHATPFALLLAGALTSEVSASLR